MYIPSMHAGSSAPAPDGMLGNVNYIFDFMAFKVPVSNEVKHPPEIENDFLFLKNTILDQYNSIPINFAGYYLVVRASCGAGCEMPLIFNIRTGQLVASPGGISDPAGLKNYKFNRIDFRSYSKLMIVVGEINELSKNDGKLHRQYYLIENDKLHKIGDDSLTYQIKPRKWVIDP